MTTQEALALLATAPSDEQPSSLNRSLTRGQAVNILTASVKTGILDRESDPRSSILERNIQRLVSDRCRHE